MLHLDLRGTGPRYAQLARSIRNAIEAGRLRPGARLPATRELAMQLGVSRNTVLTAYEVLCSEGLAHSRGGSGTYVSRKVVTVPHQHIPDGVEPQSRYAARLRELPRVALRRLLPRPRFDLQYGEPLVNLALLSAWSKALSHATERAELHYPGAQGLRVLRDQIADHLGRHRGVVCEPDDVVVLSGTQQAVSLLSRVLADEGDEVVIEEPHYQFAAHAMLAHGLRPLSVATDHDGIVCDALPARPVRFVYVTPSHQFPTGAEMSLARRRELLRYADTRCCWIVEDDYDGEFRYEPRAMPALKALDERGRVIYVGSFSKVVFPALRLGYAVVPRGLRRDLAMAKGLDDLGCGAIEQWAMASFMRDGGFDRHLRKASTELRRRRAALIEGLLRHATNHVEIAPSRAGMHLVVWLPGWSQERLQVLIDTARNRDLGLHPIAPHYAHRPATAGLLMGFAALSVPQLKAATAVFGQVLAQVASASKA
jgi:GntR family transcriptional regulator / MocR family aminotransferase